MWADIQWYKADPKAPRLPWPQSFMSLDWTSSTWTRDRPNFQDEPWLQRPGEVFNEQRPYSPWPTPLGLDYAHVCGTEDDFVKGAKYDPDIEVKYDEQGLPLCCNGPAVPQFPMLAGFKATLDAGPTPGATCVDAGEIPLNTTQSFTINPGEVQWWKTPPLVFGNPYAVRVIPPTPSVPDLAWDGWVGPICPPAIHVGPLTNFVGCIAIPFMSFPGGFAWLTATNTGSVPRTYFIRFDDGNC